MTLYSYIVTKDGGFSPNPFFGYCTLACCKPTIRRTAKKDDWIVGLSSKATGNRIVYFMQVDEILTFDEYWRDSRFRKKRPKMKTDRARMFGDNIYEPKPGGGYRQLPSAHSKPKFRQGEDSETKEKDTIRGKRVLVATTFAYFGSQAKELPPELAALKIGRSHRRHESPELLTAFRQFVNRQKRFGVIAPPSDWKHDDGSWKLESC